MQFPVTDASYHDKNELHPSLPFLRLRSRQQLHSSGSFLVFYRINRRHDHCQYHDTKHGIVVIVIPWVANWPIVQKEGDKQNAQNVSLCRHKGFATLPLIENRVMPERAIAQGLKRGMAGIIRWLGFLVIRVGR
jgi:hypothetical protein